MELTEEQKTVVNHQGDACVNAVAGSGKTSTLISYAQARPQGRILYLAFNRSVKDEAVRKFRAAGCRNVTVETAHSLAFRMLDVRNQFQLLQGGSLRIPEILEMCDIFPSPKEPTAHLVLARHVQRLISMFCNSEKRSFSEIDYLSTVKDGKAKEFVTRHAPLIYDLARDLLGRMYKKEIPVSHDAYLKFWQLQGPQMQNFSHLCFDEGQDASPVMLDVFLRQRGEKIIVGDQYQSIYGFRFAVNSLEKVDFPRYQLSRSFRFGQDLADTAMRVLEIRKLLGLYKNPLFITGAAEEGRKIQSKAIVARTNLKLLKEAIDAMSEGCDKMYFEGDINSYTYLNEGASLFDVLYLNMGRKEKIKSSFIKGFADYQQLLEYIAATEDSELNLVCEIVSEYGRELFSYIRELKEKQVQRDKAEMVFSTVHKVKGMEFDQVKVCDDFITERKLWSEIDKAKKDPKKKIDRQALAEEINMLYVAATRSRCDLDLPNNLFLEA
ncbi:UvrD-helicase domain-containing protein [Geoalkalibacter subterraneus]|uniref:UvrD-helicase domain-containing protein n=1 Tax=Geoalkalibacter subterraneus TaxID=483547 RepID=UPI000694A81E|nr:UvrD-helicase domain-containing protein [Geoalkalibacter subterraneus]